MPRLQITAIEVIFHSPDLCSKVEFMGTFDPADILAKSPITPVEISSLTGSHAKVAVNIEPHLGLRWSGDCGAEVGKTERGVGEVPPSLLVPAEPGVG